MERKLSNSALLGGSAVTRLSFSNVFQLIDAAYQVITETMASGFWWRGPDGLKRTAPRSQTSDSDSWNHFAAATGLTPPPRLPLRLRFGTEFRDAGGPDFKGSGSVPKPTVCEKGHFFKPVPPTGRAKGRHQSSRNAIAGSTRVARRAGPRHAAIATKVSRQAAKRNDDGSVAVT